jgi:hypothetical protein
MRRTFSKERLEQWITAFTSFVQEQGLALIDLGIGGYRTHHFLVPALLRPRIGRVALSTGPRRSRLQRQKARAPAHPDRLVRRAQSVAVLPLLWLAVEGDPRLIRC